MIGSLIQARDLELGQFVDLDHDPVFDDCPGRFCELHTQNASVVSIEERPDAYESEHQARVHIVFATEHERFEGIVSIYHCFSPPE